MSLTYDELFRDRVHEWLNELWTKPGVYETMKLKNCKIGDFKVRKQNVLVVELRGETDDGEPAALDLAVKHREMNVIRQMIDPNAARFRAYFENEINFYRQMGGDIRGYRFENLNFFDHLPYCYRTLFSDDSAAFISPRVIVLENIEKRNYRLWKGLEDPPGAMTLIYIDIVLQAYAKLHGLSLKLLKHNPGLIDEIITSLNAISRFPYSREHLSIYDDSIETLYNYLKENEEDEEIEAMDLAEFTERCYNCFQANRDGNFRKVILHGDCWSDNYMFNQKEQVMILDWQMAHGGGVIADVSSFLITYLPEAYIEQMKNILSDYYYHLTNIYKAIERKDYPMTDFSHEWKMQCRIGFILAIHTVIKGNAFLDVNSSEGKTTETTTKGSIEGITKGSIEGTTKGSIEGATKDSNEGTTGAAAKSTADKAAFANKLKTMIRHLRTSKWMYI